MAAFPGLFAGQCRSKAYLEALERFCLIAWWDGRLPAQVLPTDWADVSALQIEHPLERGVMVVLFKQCSPGGFFSYGHAAGADFGSACQRAWLLAPATNVSITIDKFSNPPLNGGAYVVRLCNQGAAAVTAETLTGTGQLPKFEAISSRPRPGIGTSI
jgi:hypothetical protein